MPDGMVNNNNLAFNPELKRKFTATKKFGGRVDVGLSNSNWRTAHMQLALAVLVLEVTCVCTECVDNLAGERGERLSSEHELPSVVMSSLFVALVIRVEQ